MQLKKDKFSECQWLKPVILAIWEADNERIPVQGQPQQIVLETPSPN
jgi:hypothetical protein